MAKILSNSGIVTGQPVEAHHVSQSVNALTAAEAYDISISGSLTVNNILYPIVDGASGSVLVTNGAGETTFAENNSISSSYVSSSNVDGPLGMDSVQSSVNAETASIAGFATNASSSILAARAITADSSTTSSYALTASYIEGEASKKFDFTLQTVVPVVHGLGTENLVVQVYEETGSLDPVMIIPDTVRIDDNNQITVQLSRPTSGYVVISGGGFLRSGSVDTAASASIAARVNNPLLNGTGIAPFVYDGSSISTVSLDPNYLIPSSSFSQTASFALRVSGSEAADSASYVRSSNVDGPLGMDSILSASYALTASYIDLVETRRFNFTNITSITVPHQLDSENVFLQVYQDDATTGGIPTQIVPDSIRLIDNNNATVTFAVPTTGFIVAGQSGFLRDGVAESSSYAITASYALNAEGSDGSVITSSVSGYTQSFTRGDGSTYENYLPTASLSASYAVTASHITGIYAVHRENFTNVTNYIATHTFGTEDVVVQVYEIISGTPTQIIPDDILIINTNQVQLQFASNTTGYVVITRGGFVQAGTTTNASTASYASRTEGTLSNGLGVETFSFDGSANTIVTVNTASTHFREGAVKAVDENGRITVPIFNDDNVAISKSDPIYVEEFDGTHYRVRRADASDSSRMPAIGLANEDLALGETGLGVLVGQVSGLNTFGSNAGRNIYVAPGGGYTQTEPTSPNLSQPLGVIGEESATQGRIVVQGPVAPVGSGNAVTASYISSSNVDGPYGLDSILTASFALTASYVEGIVSSFRSDFNNLTTVTVNHGLNTEDIVVQVYQEDATTGNLPVQIVPDSITLTSLDQIEVQFAVATTGYVVISRGGFLRSGSQLFAETASYALRTDSTSNVKLPIYNDDNVLLNIGDPIYVEEFDGTHYRVRRADASDSTRMPAIGIVTSTLPLGATGEVLIVGELSDLNTFGLNAGRNIYVAPGGGITQTEPGPPNLSQPLGIVGEESATVGKLIIQGPAAPVGSGNAQTASIALTASYVSSSNVDGPLGMDSILSASYALTASHIPGITQAIRSDFINQTNITIAHGLNTENITVQVYQDDAVTGNLPTLILPDNVVLTDLNTVDITLAAASSGHVVITQGGFLRSGSINFAYTASQAFSSSIADTASYSIFSEESERTTVDIFNDDTVGILLGDPVYIEESDGNRYRVRRADASDLTRMPAVGLAQSNIPVGAVGKAVVLGTLENVNTFGFTIGRNIYVAPGGGWTQTRPGGGDGVQPIGVIGEESTIGGQIFVNGPQSIISDIAVNTGSFVITSSITGFTQSFTRGDGSTYDNIIESASFATTASYALTASFISGGIFTERFDFVNVPAFTVPHSLDTENVFVQVYQDDAATGNIPTLILPDDIQVPTTNQVDVTLAAPTTGYAVVTRGGFVRAGTVINAITASYIDNTYKQDVAGGLTYAITHNLNEEFPIVQAYELTTRAQEIPASIVSAGPQSVTVTFAAIFQGTIIVKK